MALNHVLFQDPWIIYNNTFIQSRLMLLYPENVIFTTQLLNRVTQSDIYQSYPFAEKFKASTLEDVDWEKTVIAFNHDLQLTFAPDPVQQLIRLDRRLNYRDAEKMIFGPFRWSLVEVFRYQWLGILSIVLTFIIFRFVERRYVTQKHSLKIPPNKTFNVAK